MEQIVGAMLAAACGDALGAPIEFMDALTVRRRYGKVTDMMGGGPWSPGEWTDDTGLTLCVAEGILEDRDDPVPAIGRHMVEWSQASKEVDRTVSAALVNYRSSGDWPQAARATPQAKAGRAAGNGSLMRTLPVALAYGDPGEMLAKSAEISAMTHWDPRAEVTCAVYCLWIHGLLAGAEVEVAWWESLEGGRKLAAESRPSASSPGPAPLPGDFWQRFETVKGKRYESLQASGYADDCAECLEAAAWCCLQAADLEAAVLDAVNLAGESDTIGALAGGAAGARWGAGDLPEPWLSKLRDRDRIADVARRLAALRAGGS